MFFLHFGYIMYWHGFYGCAFHLLIILEQLILWWSVISLVYKNHLRYTLSGRAFE